MQTKSQEDATLLDILIDGFDKNEIFRGFHWRSLPMPSEAAAVRKFAALIEEARLWKGEPTDLQEGDARRMAAWPDLEVLQAGRGVMVRVRAPFFDRWWHAENTWDGNPMASLYEWLRERGE